MDEARKQLLVFAGAFVAAGLVIATVVFPFWNLIREDVYEQVEILDNINGVCYVETDDDVPKTIQDCSALPGDTVEIVFGRDLAWAAIVEPQQ